MTRTTEGPSTGDGTGPVDLLVRGGTVVTVDGTRRILNDGALAVRDGRLVAVGDRREIEDRVAPERVLDATGRYVFPGLINTHTHLFQTLLKGLGDDRALVDWFRRMTGPAAVQLTEEDCYLGAAVGCLEAIRSGTTTVKDFMYTHPRPGLMDAVATAFEDIGLRGVLGRGFCDTGASQGVPTELIEELDTALADCQRVIDRYHQRGLLTVYVAPTMIWTVTERALAEAAALAEQSGVGFAMHMSETCFERDYSQQQFSRDDFQMLERTGALGPRTLAVHCVHADADDIALMAAHDVKVSHNATSNMYLGSGVPPVPELLKAGVTVGLASDGPASNNNQNMIEVLKFSALMHKVHAMDARIITAERILEMATRDGARALGLDDLVGSLEIGKRADFFIADFASAHASPVHNPVSALVYSASGAEVQTVVVDGSILLDNGRFPGLDETDLIARAQRAADGLVARAGISDLKNRPWRSLALSDPPAV